MLFSKLFHGPLCTSSINGWIPVLHTTQMPVATLKCAVGKSLVGRAFIVHDWEGCDWSLMPSSTRSVTLDSCTLLSGALAGHGVADCPKLTLLFKCTRRVSPQQWPKPGVLMSEPLFMFPYHCQMYAFKPGISARCSSSDHNPVSTLFFSPWENQKLWSYLLYPP